MKKLEALWRLLVAHSYIVMVSRERIHTESPLRLDGKHNFCANVDIGVSTDVFDNMVSAFGDKND